MSGGAGGSILAMILSLKNNKAILPKRKSLKEIRNIYLTNINHQKLYNKKSDPEFLKALRIQLIKERRAEITKRIVLICFAIIVAIGLLYIPILLLRYYVPKFKQESVESYNANKKRENYKAYEMFIYYGDYHFNHKEYNDAVRNYRLALKISPDKNKTYNDLAIVYYYACLDSNLYCQEAITSLSGIIDETDTAMYALKHRSEIYMHLGEFKKAENDLNRIEGNK